LIKSKVEKGEGVLSLALGGILLTFSKLRDLNVSSHN